MLTVLILILSNLFMAIFMTESKELKLTLHLAIGAMKDQAYHKDQLKDLFFLLLIYIICSLTLYKSTSLIMQMIPHLKLLVRN